MSLLTRRRMMLANQRSSTPILPSEYQQVEYIENTSNSYIKIPTFTYTQNSVIKCRFYKSTPATSEQSLFMVNAGNKTVIEVGFTSGNLMFAFSTGGSSSKIYSELLYGAWVDYTATYQSEVPTKKSVAIINGAAITGTDGTGTNATGTAAGRLFINPRNNTMTCLARLASLSLTLEGVLTFNAIPCYRKSDGEIGVYDTVSQTFFANSGNGAFIKGADVN